jgi:hypothetical protein
MHVGVVELMETGHIALVETVSRVFCSEPGNKVTVYTTAKHARNLDFLLKLLPNLEITVKPGEVDEKGFLQRIAVTPHDRIYVITMTRLFPEFARWPVTMPLFLVIHNLDEWYGLSFSGRIIKFINAGMQSCDLNSVVYHFKMYLLYYSFKKRILKKVNQTHGKVVVLSEAVRSQFEKFRIREPAEVIPFSVFDPSLIRPATEPTSPLRICVPGILSQYRRNYIGLLELMEKSLTSLKGKFIIDLLGGVQPDNPLNQCETILEKIEILKNKGFSVIVHNVRFIPPEEYDRNLSSCDIILGNMNVVLNNFSQYGKTKETGLPFAMIKAGKPGILPKNYPAPEEIGSGILTYNSYEDLGRLLQDLINDRSYLVKLQEKALENSSRFSPDVIYKKLMSS